MGLFNFWKKPILPSNTASFGSHLDSIVPEINGVIPNGPTADWGLVPFGYGFDGESSPGMAGPLRKRNVNHTAMNIRAMDIYLSNEIAKLVIDRYVKWIVSSGLDLELNPNIDVMRSFGVNYTRDMIEQSNQHIETMFGAWGESKACDFRGLNTFADLQKNAFRTAKLAGDVLVILRYDKNKKQVSVELINSDRLTTPIILNENWSNGLFINERGGVDKYCVSSPTAKDGYVIYNGTNKDKLKQVFLFRMDQYRVEDVRGLSALSASIDSVQTAERYKNATVEGAEERAKIPLSIKHDLNSDGASPFSQMAAAMKGITPDVNGTNAGEAPTTDTKGEILRNKIAATTSKQVINMTPGSELVMHEAKTDDNFPAFIDKIIEITASAIGIPHNVAMMLYNNSFSASRAAINDWIHTIRVDRTSFTKGFLKPIFEFWLYYTSMDELVSLPHYVLAVQNENEYLKTAFTKCEFVGEMFPHIDPMKEVKAERAKLGPSFDNIPLTTVERAMRQLGNNDSDAVIGQAKAEFDEYSSDFSVNSDNN